MKVKNHRLTMDNGDPVEFVATPNKGGVIKPTVLVLHDTAGRLDHRTSVSWLCDKAAKASAHFVVGRAHEIVQLCPTNVAAWHAGASSYKGRPNVNQFSIGVELVNPGRMSEAGSNARAWFGETYSQDEYSIDFVATPEHGGGLWMPYTEAQIEDVIEMGLALREAYDLIDVTTHWAISPGRKVDTNPLFPLEEVRSRILGRQTGAAPSDGVLRSTTLANVNHRRWPSYADNVIQVIPRGTIVETLRSGSFANGDEIARWELVRHCDHEGWVHGDYLAAF